MYEFSIDYLRKLIAKSGLKMGIQKQAAMVAIIELLDEKRLDGLIKSIQADYDSMVAEIGQKDIVIEQRVKELDRLNIEIEQLREDIDKKRKFILVEGMLPEERSRVLAFNAAMKLAEERYGHEADADQIIRSASNVAANWRHEPEKACGKEINREDHH